LKKSTFYLFCVSLEEGERRGEEGRGGEKMGYNRIISIT
jgi:hypothetical protein